MIDVAKEQLQSLAEAARNLPRRRAGKRPHPSTLFRWASHGLRGIKLEVVKIGGTTCTSRESLQRFFQRLTELDGKFSGPKEHAFVHQPHEEEIDRELDTLGL